MFYEFLQDPPIFLEKKTRVSGFPVDFPTNPLIQDPTEFLHHDAPQLLFSARV
jgi:hypothetical protein